MIVTLTSRLELKSGVSIDSHCEGITIPVLITIKLHKYFTSPSISREGYIQSGAVIYTDHTQLTL